MRYADRYISADSKYFVLAAGTRLGSTDGIAMNIYTAPAGATVSANMSGATKVGSVVTLNTEFYELDPVVTELDKTITSGNYDIYIEFTGSGTSNIEYFGFLKSGADLTNYRTQMRQWTGWASASTSSSIKPLYWLSDANEDHTRVINTFSGASLTYDKVKAVSKCTKLRVCYAAEDACAGQPITVTVKNSSGATVATGTITTRGTGGLFVEEEFSLNIATGKSINGSAGTPGIYTVKLDFGGSGNQTCQIKWFEFAQ